MAPPNNNNPTPMNISQDEDDGFTTVVRPKKHYVNSNNNNNNNNNNNKVNDNPSPSITPPAVHPIPIQGSTSTTTGNSSYPNSRLHSRSPLKTIDSYQGQTTNNVTDDSTPSDHSNEKNRDKKDDDEVMSTTSASSWGSYSSDSTNISTSGSSFSRRWSYDSRALGRRQRGQGEHHSTENNNHDNNYNNYNNYYNYYNNNNGYNYYNNNYHNNYAGNNNNYYYDNNCTNNNNNNYYNNYYHNNYAGNNSNNYNNYNYYNNKNNNNNFSSFKKWNKNKDREARQKFRESRDVDVFLNYVREDDPVPVPLEDRYDGGSIRDHDNGSGSSTEDLIKDGYDESNENHWIDAKTMVLKDKFPKARFHALVFPTRVTPTFDDLICEDGVMIVKQLVERAEIIIARESKRSPHLRFTMGFHALPSMKQVHMHVISTDMDADRTYIISVYNSFTTEAFLTPDQVIQKIESKWKVRDLEFLTEKEKKFYEKCVYFTLPTCLLCPLAQTGEVSTRSRRQRQRQARSIHNHADPDMDAELHKAAVENHDGSGIVTATATATDASLVPDTIAKSKEKQPSSTTPAATVSAIPTAGQQDVWKSSITVGCSFVPFTARYADFRLLRQHLRTHYLEQERMYFPSPSSSPPLSSSSLSPDCDLDNHDYDIFHGLNDDQNTSFIAQNTCDEGNDNNGCHKEDEDVLSSTTVPLLLIHGALDS
ncbi:hypothetical protein K457DRAFT_129283 [Linnemannia elongata AG-77]|uniref:HIT-like protein n=1 Tax=Linnemannia elongata AG-77 TaxID=1314771 RepID=A0A197JJ08_9FUNG|nr:hypothetical protein K457DRAFT_129283 [Linnemannia elongata AG-77]